MTRSTFFLPALSLVLVTLAACGSGDPDPETPLSAETAVDATTQESPPSETSHSDASTPDEPTDSTASEESPSSEDAAPAETTGAESAEGSGTQSAPRDAHGWCDALEENLDEITVILDDWSGEWGEFRRLNAQGEDASPSDESLGCGFQLGEPLKAGSLGLSVDLHDTEAAAEAVLQGLRDDDSSADPGVITNEDLPDHDGVLYTTYSAPMTMPAFASYSASWTEGAQVIRLSLRDYRMDVIGSLGAGQAPPDEADHRAQVEQLLEMLSR